MDHRRHPRNYGGTSDLSRVKQNMKNMREKVNHGHSIFWWVCFLQFTVARREMKKMFNNLVLTSVHQVLNNKWLQ